MKTWGILLVVAAIAIFAVVAYELSPKSRMPLVLSPKTMMEGIWEDYKETYVTPEGRTIDAQRDNVTTSEGQSYTMLRAVWMDDKETFDRAWEWTRANLDRPDDNLFAWLYGQRPDGSWGVLSDAGGGNSASDADTDIALALVFAYGRWQQAPYLLEARDIVRDIWENEVVEVAGRPVMTANSVERSSSGGVLVNPSYFAPYAYRIFAEIDPEHDWDGVIDSSYAIIRESTVSKLDKPESAALPPDWILLDRRTGAVSAANVSNLQTTYGYEAARLPWRLALDWIWYEEPRAKEALQLFGFLAEEWREDGKLYATYGHDGQVVGSYEAPMMYAGSLGYFLVSDPGLAKEIYEAKIASLYSAHSLTWREPLSYYDTNWTWFGLGLYHNLLINLSPFEERMTMFARFKFKLL